MDNCRQLAVKIRRDPADEERTALNGQAEPLNEHRIAAINSSR